MATAYWEVRAALRQAAYDKANNAIVASVSRTYDRVMRQLDKDIDTIMATYTRKTGLSPREAYDFLRDGVPQSVMDDLSVRISQIADPRQQKKLAVMLRTDAYRARISRLDAIKASTRVGLTEAAEAELGALEPHLRHTAELAYNRTMFDIQKVTAGFQTVGVPRKALDTILKSKWAGDTFSQSVWANRDATYSLMDKALMEVSSMGKLSDPTMKDLRGMVDLTKWKGPLKSKFKDAAQYQKYAANRLIRTESAYVANQTTAIAYEECEIEKYEFMATLDSRTSQKCSDNDGKIFDMADKKVGVNFPPLHPFCRSSVACVIDGLTRDNLTRAARDKNGKSVYVPRDMDYAEWKRWQDAGCPDVGEWRAGNIPKAEPLKVKTANPNVPIATTRIEADAVLKDMGITGMYDYAKVNVDIANAVNVEIAKTHELFGKNNVAIKFVSHKYQVSAASGSYSPVTGTMMLRNAGSKKSLTLWGETAKLENSYGTWSTSDPLHAIRHELGHALHNGVGFVKTRPVLEPIYESWKAETGLSGKWDVIANRRAGRTDEDLFKDIKKAGESLSAYGMTSVDEMVAESVAEYLAGNPRQFALKVVHALMGW
jgi:SPP1 gp7 family putative phage head morphogenesis protein